MLWSTSSGRDSIVKSPVLMTNRGSLDGACLLFFCRVYALLFVKCMARACWIMMAIFLRRFGELEKDTSSIYDHDFGFDDSVCMIRLGLGSWEQSTA